VSGRGERPVAVEELQGRIGLGGAVFTLVGYIVGGSIFILPASLAATVGPASFISYLIAGVLTLFVCCTAAQIGSAFPASGGTYVAVACVIAPFWGFVVVWMGVLIIFTSTPALAYGLVDYLAEFFPSMVPYRVAVAVGAIVLFTGVNLLGIRTAMRAQAVMVIGFMAVLLLIGIDGLAHADAANFSPLLPLGIKPVLWGAIPAYYSFSGFSAIVAFGGEIERPRRNLPLTLAISYPIILITYTMVGIAVPGVVPWSELGATSTVSRAAARFLPPTLVFVVAAGAVLAIATSINGLILSKSRELFALAVDKVLPSHLARVGHRYGEPRTALLAMSVVAIAGALIGRSFTEYASMSVLCVMVVQILSGLTIVVLPTRMPAAFQAAAFKLGPRARWFWGIGLTVCSLGFIIAGLMGDTIGALIYVVAFGIGALGYAARRFTLRRRGVRIEDLLLRRAAHLLTVKRHETSPGEML
jgi:basic amino acid/polyamine antiporter, APA family